MIKTDFLVIGSGIAGLRAALELSKHKVALVTKKRLTDANTYYAQGGISAVPITNKHPLEGDSFESHIEDTEKAGAGICNKKVVEYFAKNAFNDVILPLIKEGVKFTESKKGYKYSLHQEGGHSSPRIFHVADYTGKAIEEALEKKARENSNITIYEDHMAIDLITKKKLGIKGEGLCLGAYVLDAKGNKVITFSAKATFLATGGAGRVYLYTSNPDTATGDGIAMAKRLGLTIENMEFMQFHPTCLYNPSPKSPDDRRFLITEALRGKNIGGILVLKRDSKEDFVKALGYHKDGSASTRDIVSRAIDIEMKKRGLDHVYLNVTPEVTGKSAEELKEGFPEICQHCLSLGIDITKEPIPVVPAAHYTCGGVKVNINGETELKGLYAIGEVACTGLHGANRLASNSLSEAALFGKAAVAHALNNSNREAIELKEWNIGKAVESRDEVQVAQNWDEARRMMWNLVGIARNEERLLMAKRRIRLIQEEINKYYWHYIVTLNLLELRNIAEVAGIIIDSALKRKESIGTHLRLDYP
ncbi:MAG: L-aspartate oxidase [Candidatus Woesearchaeota archaeon]